MVIKKKCPSCGEEKPLNEDNFYPARPRVGHKKQGWQSYCKDCWPQINKRNKINMGRLKGLVKNEASASN